MGPRTDRTRKKRRSDRRRKLHGIKYGSKCKIVFTKYLRASEKNPSLEFNREFINKAFDLPKTTVDKMMIDYQEAQDSE